MPITELPGAASVHLGGGNSGIVLKADGSVAGWGSNNQGQLGTGGADPSYVWPPVAASAVPLLAALSASQTHALGLTASGAVWAWGGNGSGQLGHGFMSPWEPPGVVAGLGTTVSVACSPGGSTSFAVLVDGTVRGWGENPNGQLATGDTNPSSVPIPVGTLAGVLKVAAGHDHVAALKSNGTVFCWGNNNHGQLGFGSTGPAIFAPLQVPILSGIVDISARDAGTMALRSDGAIFAWGFNASGRFGIGNSSVNAAVPTPVQTLVVSNATEVSLGNGHALARTPGGHIFAWGSNSNGQTGSDMTPNVPTEPVILATMLGPCPTISAVSITHSSLVGNVPMTITGDNFLSTTIVSVGGIPITTQLVVDSHTINGKTPGAAAPGLLPVSINTGAGTTTFPSPITYDHAVLNVIGVPQIGGSFDVRISSYPSKPLIFIGDAVPGPTPIGIYGYVGVGLSSQMIVALDYFGAFTNVPDPNAVLDASGQWTSPVPVPNIPGLAGQTVYGQAYAFSFAPFPSNTLFFPTNTQAITFHP